MASVPAPIAVDGDTYTVPGADTIEPLAVSVTFDGSGAGGDFLPCLTFYSQSGQLISRTFPAEAVTAGESAEVSYIPFVPPASGGGTALPFWTNILSSLSLQDGSIDHTGSFAWSMVQAEAKGASVFLFLHLRINVAPGAGNPVAILNLPSFTWGDGDSQIQMGRGLSWISGTAYDVFLAPNGSVNGVAGALPDYAHGDVGYSGSTVYFWNPE